MLKRQEDISKIVIDKRNVIKAVLLLLVLCCLTYSNSVQGGFMMDDYLCLLHKNWSPNLTNIGRCLQPPVSDIHYRPASCFSRMLEYNLFKETPFYYRVTNIALFYVNCCLVYLLLYALTQKHEIALLAGLLFCVHPINSSSINYITAYEFLLFGFFSLLALLLFRLHVQKYPESRFCRLSLLMFIFSLLTHEIAITIPLYIGWMLWYGKGYDLRKTIKLCRSFLLIAFLFIFSRLAFVGMTRDVFNGVLKNIQTHEVNFLNYCVSMADLMYWYISKLFIPEGIVLTQGMAPDVNHVFLKNFIFWISLLGIVISLWYGYRRRGDITFFALFWFLSGFLPVGLLCFIYPASGLTIEPHWFFISSIGFFVLAATFLIFLKKYINRIIYLFLVFSLLLSLCLKTREYNTLWQKEERYCRYWLTVSSQHHLPNFWLGYLYFNQRDYEAAKVYFKKALVGGFIDWEVYVNLGVIALNQGNVDLATTYFNKALTINPKSRDAYNNLGVIYREKKQFDKAREYFLHAIESDGYFLAARLNLASMYRRQGRIKEAVRTYEGIRKIYPREASSTRALEEIGRKE